MANKDLKILIVGAGIGGLAAAGFLEKKGFNVTLIERAPEFKHIGFGVTVFSNGRQMLEELGLDERISKKGFQIPSIRLTDIKGNLIGKKVEFKDFYKFGEPVITIERADLHEELVNNLQTTNLRLGTIIKEFESDENHVEVTFSDGTKEVFDLMIAADGIRSGIREDIFGYQEADFYGWSLRVFWVPEGVPIAKEAICLTKERLTLAIYPLKDKSFAGIYEYNITRRDSHTLQIKDFVPYLLNHGWQQKHIDTLIEEAKEGHQYYDHLQHVRLGEWYKRRIVLLGDARHGFSPITGMGGSMAMEDAFALADELAKVNTANISIALKRYSARRTARLKQMKSLSSLVEKFYFIKNPAERILRNIISNVFGLHIKNLLVKKLSRLLAMPY